MLPLTPTAYRPPTVCRSRRRGAATMSVSGADPLPLLQLLFPGLTDEPVAQAELAEGLQATATWRCTRLLCAPPCDSVGDASSTISMKHGLPCPGGRGLQRTAVARVREGFLLLQTRDADSQLQVQPLTAGPCGVLAQHPQSLAIPTLAPPALASISIDAVLGQLDSGLLLLVREAATSGHTLSRALYVPLGHAGRPAWLDDTGARGCGTTTERARIVLSPPTGLTCGLRG